MYALMHKDLKPNKKMNKFLKILINKKEQKWLKEKTKRSKEFVNGLSRFFD